jgi:uncharacterized protein (DUF952 family)
MTGSTRIFHIATAREWADAATAGSYTRSTRGRSLAEVGYLHASYADQVAGVHAAIYADCDEPLVLLEIDPALVAAEIKVESLYGSTERYPHIYGPLEIDAVVSVRDYP